MSIVAIYDALKEAKVSDQKATAAVEAIEAVREESRLRRIEESIGELRADMNAQIGELRAETRSDTRLLKWMCGFNMALTLMTLAIVIRLAFGG